MNWSIINFDVPKQNNELISLTDLFNHDGIVTAYFRADYIQPHMKLLSPYKSLRNIYVGAFFIKNCLYNSNWTSNSCMVVALEEKSSDVEKLQVKEYLVYNAY